jgi:hypothetical protein
VNDQGKEKGDETHYVGSGGASLLVMVAGVALAKLEIDDDEPNTITGTTGDSDGLDTIFDQGYEDQLNGSSVADQIYGGEGDEGLDNFENCPDSDSQERVAFSASDDGSGGK